MSNQWYKPWKRPDNSSSKHKSCWNCEFIRIKQMFCRKCALYAHKHIWGNCSENEFQELGFTFADQCSSYKFDEKTGKVDSHDELRVEKEKQRIKLLKLK